MTPWVSKVRVSEPRACLHSGSALGKMIAVTEPDKQLLPVWTHHEDLLTTCGYRKHFTGVKKNPKINGLKK